MWEDLGRSGTNLGEKRSGFLQVWGGAAAVCSPLALNFPSLVEVKHVLLQINKKKFPPETLFSKSVLPDNAVADAALLSDL